MLNYYIYHTLPGAKYALLICTCGHIEKHMKDKKELNVTSNTKCPVCNSHKVEYFKTLSFDNQNYDSLFYLINEDETKKYKFTIDIGYIEGAVKLKYSKKMIEFDEPSLKQTHYRLYFDGSLPVDDMFKIINVDTNEEVEPAEIYSKFMLDSYKSINLLYNSHSINNSSKLSLYSFYNTNNIVDNIRMNINRIIDLKPYCEKYEQLIKIGIDPVNLTGTLSLGESNPQAQLRLSPFMFKYLKENDGARNHRALQSIESSFGNQAINYMDTFANLKDGLSASYIRRISELVNKANLSIKKLYRYLYIDAPAQQGLYNPQSTLTLLYDSFDLAYKLELPFDKNCKALQRYHDILTKEYNVVNDERKNEMFAKSMTSYKDLEFIEKSIPKEEVENDEELKTKKRDRYAMILPKDAQDLIKEGKIMRHCVAGYVDRVIKGDSIIIYLRRAKDLETPYVTIEICPDDMRIVQVKTKANGRLNEKHAIEFLDKWCEEKNINYNKHIW